MFLILCVGGESVFIFSWRRFSWLVCGSRVFFFFFFWDFGFRTMILSQPD